MRERHLEEPEVLATGEDEQPENEVILYVTLDRKLCFLCNIFF